MRMPDDDGCMWVDFDNDMTGRIPNELQRWSRVLEVDNLSVLVKLGSWTLPSKVPMVPSLSQNETDHHDTGRGRIRPDGHSHRTPSAVRA